MRMVIGIGVEPAPTPAFPTQSIASQSNVCTPSSATPALYPKVVDSRVGGPYENWRNPVHPTAVKPDGSTGYA